MQVLMTTNELIFHYWIMLKNLMECVNMCSPEFEVYANCLAQEFSIVTPQTLDEAVQLFFLIVGDTHLLMSEIQQCFIVKFFHC